MPPIKLSFFDLFLYSNKCRRYLFGINEYSEYITRIVNITGFIDDYTDNIIWMNKPVIKLAAAESDSLVVSCVTANRPITALNRLHQAGIQCYCDYFSFADASKGKFPQVAAITETRLDYQKYSEEYQWIRKQLYDQKSRDVFDSVMQFRIEGNLQPMSKFEYAAHRQYFEPFLQLKTGEVFVDGGGFDGFTSQEFAGHCPDYSAIHFFEPSAATLATAKIKLSQLANIHYYQLGLYDKNTTLKFDSTAGSASRISENGGEKIQVARLDDVIDTAVSFIKLDLEGAEIAALRGMEHHIMNDHPKLAVAVYHHPSHFWKIPRHLLGLRTDYRIYLRHYTEGWTESVMFFIPD